MAKIEYISMAEVEKMSGHRLQMEIGKRGKFLKEEFGMDAQEAADFIGGLLNLGAAMDKELKRNRKKPEET